MLIHPVQISWDDILPTISHFALYIGRHCGSRPTVMPQDVAAFHKSSLSLSQARVRLYYFSSTQANAEELQHHIMQNSSNLCA